MNFLNKKILLNTLENELNSEYSFVVFTASKTLTSWLIRKITGGKFSHVFIARKSCVNCVCPNSSIAVDITPLGIRLLSIEDALKNVSNFEMWRHSEYLLDDAWKYSFQRVGVRYDYEGIFSFFKRIIIKRITGKNKFKNHDNKKRDFCSEMVSTALSKEIIDCFQGINYFEISPDNLYDIITEAGLYFESEFVRLKNLEKIVKKSVAEFKRRRV